MSLNTPACLPEYNGVLGSAPQGSFGIANTSGVLQCVPLPPRMTGLTLKYKYLKDRPACSALAAQPAIALRAGLRR